MSRMMCNTRPAAGRGGSACSCISWRVDHHAGCGWRVIAGKMKALLHVRWVLVTLAAILLSACVTGRLPTAAGHSSANELDATIDTIVNDKSTWVDPVNVF